MLFYAIVGKGVYLLQLSVGPLGLKSPVLNIFLCSDVSAFSDKPSRPEG